MILITNLLRNLMRGNGQRGANAEWDRNEYRRGDDRAVGEIVQGTADKNEGSARVVDVAIFGMAVAPQHEFLDYEEHENAGE